MNRQKRAAYVQAVEPWSAKAFLFAAIALAVAAAVRSAFAYLGATLFFATYFPVVLIVSVIAGVPAGTATALFASIIVWWAYIPPYYSFNPLSGSEFANFSLYAVSAALIIGLSHLYRTTLTELLGAQREKDLLVEELNHRAGNLLTVVQSIVRGTLRNEKQSALKLSHRIEALARADDLVSRTLTSGVLLGEVLKRETSPYAALRRVSLTGPEVFVSAKACRNVSLVVHELATNSAKYGALSQQGGKLDITWQVMGDRCVIWWEERGGPPIKEPTRVGFGSQMILASLQTIGGTIDQEFGPSGYSCQLSFSFETMRAPSDSTSLGKPNARIQQYYGKQATPTVHATRLGD